MSDSPIDPHPADTPPLPTVGPYRLVRLIGAGGFAAVYLAADPDGRKTALKIPHLSGIFDTDVRARFVSEVAAHQRLDHQNVVRVTDASEDGVVCYLAMEYTPPPTLCDRLTEWAGPAPTADTVRLVWGIAAGVAHAHGVTHRDIKPANVLLAGDTPKVTDFGLAQIVNRGEQMSVSGGVVGTPG